MRLTLVTIGNDCLIIVLTGKADNCQSCAKIKRLTKKEMILLTKKYGKT